MNNKEVTLSDIKQITKSWISYLLSRWLLIIAVAFLFGVIGVTYAWIQKPVYTAELTFAPENDRGTSSIAGYAGIAAQFGLDIGGGGGVFEGENLKELLKSNLLIQKALLTSISRSNTKDVLINYYIQSHQINKNWNKDKILSKVAFSSDYRSGDRVRDSILNSIIREIDKSLEIDRIDSKVNIIAARMKDSDELFCKMFIEQLVTTGIQYYVDYRSKKTKENVQILQRQTDSVRSILTGNIVSVAESSDLNVNPIRQIVRANVQRKQVDVQANSALYAELVKNLELAKITLRKETPLVQIIDTPVLPLEKKKPGRALTGILFSIIGGILCVMYLVVSRWYKSI
jgi:LPS O-antigen subunit length determinant protein (WzzB/FepE family)